MFKPKGVSVDACFMQPIPGSYLVELQPAVCEMIKRSSQTNVDRISCFISDIDTDLTDQRIVPGVKLSIF